ncbi:hypothetical protein GCM10009803_22040 [Microbacterium ginsengiterrae]
MTLNRIAVHVLVSLVFCTTSGTTTEEPAAGAKTAWPTGGDTWIMPVIVSTDASTVALVEVLHAAFAAVPVHAMAATMIAAARTRVRREDRPIPVLIGPALPSS